MRIIEIGENGPYSCLNNYAMTPFKDNNVTYLSALHAYYIYLCPDKFDIICATKSVDELQNIIGFDAYKMASNLMNHRKTYDFNNTFIILRSIIFLKVISNPNVKAILLSTNKAYLSVLNRSDLVLGCGKSRMGINLTGLMLMEVRDYLMQRKSWIVYHLTCYIRSRIGFRPFVEELNDSYSTACDDPEVPV
jgi:predicted NAD-dependent protein-ADP-ribosyltransferase YbiA (DUF1768 family)